MVWIIVISALSVLDQWIKGLIRSKLSLSQQIPVIDRFFYLTRRENTGAAWSFLANVSWGLAVLTVVSFILTAGLVILLVRSPAMKMRLCLSLIIAGSIGNLIDRIRYGAVTDYLDFHFGSYVFPTFNLADTLIVCGTILLGLFVMLDPPLMDTLMPKGWS